MKKPRQLSDHATKLVFIPGWGFHSSIWLETARHLSDYAIYRADLPLTNLPAAPANDALHALASRIQHQIPQHAVLIAWSLGGLVATKLCRQYPDKCLKLILVASTPRFSPDENWPGLSHDSLAQFQSAAKSSLPAAIRSFLVMISTKKSSRGTRTVLHPHCQSTSEKDALLYYLDILANADMRADLHQCQSPVLHLFGSHDPLISKAHRNKIQDEYPGHETTVIQGAGHIPFLSHTAVFNHRVRHFLNQEF